MLVENYADRWPAPHFNMTLVREDARMSKRAHARMCREAAAFFDGFGLDFSQFDGPDLVFHNMCTATATWTHRVTGNQVELSSIWFDEKTGAINQAGSNYGRLSL